MNRSIMLINITRLIILSCFLLIFLFSGCVSSKKYNDLEIQNATTEQELAQAQELYVSLAKEKNEQERVMKEMIESLKAEIEDKTVQIEMLEERLRITIVDRLFFASGSAEVNRTGQDILARIAPSLQNAENQEIRIVGHADSVPIGKKLSATYLSNWELSTARATSIVRILQWGYDIAPERLVAEGVAQYRPLVMETVENRASNRVVEIILTSMTDTQ